MPCRVRYPNVQHLMNELQRRPAVERALRLKARHPFKAELDEGARQVMFPGNGKPTAAAA